MTKKRCKMQTKLAYILSHVLSNSMVKKVQVFERIYWTKVLEQTDKLKTLYCRIKFAFISKPNEKQAKNNKMILERFTLYLHYLQVSSWYLLTKIAICWHQQQFNSTKGSFAKCSYTTLLIRTRTCAYQGVRNVSFSENFVSVLNEWSL